MGQLLNSFEIERLVKLCSIRKITSGKYDVLEYLRKTDGKYFRTSVWVKNDAIIVVITPSPESVKPNQHRLNINKSLRVNKIVDAFKWGTAVDDYDVNGSYQLSLALLLESLGYSAFAKQIALFFYRQFAIDVVQKLPKTWQLSVYDIIGWIKTQLESKTDIELLREHRISQDV
jgi:hypothetical protein